MTATTRLTDSNAVPATLYMAMELGGTKWTLGFATSLAQRPRVRQVSAGDRDAVVKEVLSAKAHLGLPLDAPVRSCYEAGRDGFWVHRWLGGERVENVVVESASIEVNRRARRAKTDRLDVGQLLTMLQRYWGGERKVWSVVRVPSALEEAQRPLTREIATVREDRKRVRNRRQALLATQGVPVPLTAGFAERVRTARTGDGQSMPAAFSARLAREWEHLDAIDRRLADLTAERDHAMATGTDRVAHGARRLCDLRGLAETSAAVFSAELVGTRTFANGRQLSGLVGLVPVPSRSDQLVQDQGISKAGRAELRRMAIQVAWGWVRWQPDSALTQWFQHRFAAAGGRSKRIGIVAVARKLLIALWRYVDHGVEIPGAVLKPGTQAQVA